tara:strand:- start:2614 stop:3036 length:423 start_codon:yes stop_codon:yes gene_type:complete
MIANIREYINKSVRLIDSDLKPAKFALIGNTADTKIENTFEVIFGSLSSEREEYTINSVIPLTVSIYKNGFKDETENFDKNYCKAIDIQSVTMDQALFRDHGGILDVESSGIEVETVLSNDNLFKYTIQFNIRVNYKYEL